MTEPTTAEPTAATAITAKPIMTEILRFKDELGFCTRNDGVSGMSVTALADFCGVDQPAITQLLNKIRDSSPITKDLPKALEAYSGKEWRLITNDEQNSLFVIDELCHAILEYYAFDARKYKGKAAAVDNYKMVAKAGLRVFIWAQTGYTPQPIAIAPEQIALLESIPAMQAAIAQLQSQVLALLPPSADFIPPGWDNETWESLPPQDKRHFRYIWRRRNFQPSPEESKEAEPILAEEVKQQQQAELKRVAGEVPFKEMWRIEDAKQEMLAKFWAQFGGENEK